MKKALFIALLMLGCSDFKQTPVSKTGEVEINGKHCKVMILQTESLNSFIYVDCGPCSESSVTYQQGKSTATVIESPASSCSCPNK